MRKRKGPGRGVPTSKQRRERERPRKLSIEPLEDRELLSISPPVIEEILLAGRNWSDAFLAELAARGEGSRVHGFRLTAENAATPLPWSNLDRLAIRFSEAVQVGRSDLRIQGVDAGATISLAANGFHYDPTTYTAFWTFATPLDVDQYAIRVRDRVSDDAGNPLDGDGPLGAGDGIAGGDLLFAFAVVPGDGNQDGRVDLTDGRALRERMFATTTSERYSPRYDFDGSGATMIADSLIHRAHLSGRLPTGELDIGAPLLTAGLQRDTAPSGLVNADGITFDSTIAGRVTDPLGGVALRASVDGGTPAPVVIRADGTFQFDPALALDGSEDGDHVVQFLAEDAFGNESGVVVAFTLDTRAPILEADLSIASDTGELGDRVTAAAVVNVTGRSEPLRTVSLEEPNRAALVGSDGRFSLPDVPLPVGETALSILVADAAGNTARRKLSVVRTDQSLDQDAVLTWNQVLLEAIRKDATTPPQATRGMAMVHTAIFDAISAIEGTPAFLVNLPAPAGASPEAAVGAAAHRVLAYLFPAQVNEFDLHLTATLGGIPDGPSEDYGVALGASIGDAVIAARAADGWNDFVEYVLPEVPGNWRPTAPMYELPLLPQWADLTPFGIGSPDPFLPDGPPELTSEAYASAVNEVQSLGRSTGSARTADQMQIARFWADGSGTYTPPGHWLAIASQIARERGNSLAGNARLFAALSVAVADAAIVSWKVKYDHGLWRPIDAIQQAHLDDNPLTVADATWEPLLLTPPFPEYISGHSTFSGAASRVLTRFFGDNVAFATTSIGLPGVTRAFASFDAAAEEAGRGRVYGGIHFEFSNQDGLQTGRAVGDFVFDRFQTSQDLHAPTIIVEEPTASAVVTTTLVIEGRVFDNLAGVASLEYRLDDGGVTPLSWDPTGRFSLRLEFPSDGGSDGVHTLYLLARDFAGNSAVPRRITFRVDNQAPVIDLVAPSLNQDIDIGSHLIGTVAVTGSSIVRLGYRFDGGEEVPIGFDPLTGAFDEWLRVAPLSLGNHLLTVSTMDAGGNVRTITRNVHVGALAPFTILGITPADGAEEVGATFRPQIFFSRPVDPATLTSASLFATNPAGAKLPATIVPSADGTFAWLFFTEPLPGASTITVHIVGDLIRALADGAPLDPDFNGVAGGTVTYGFTTVSLVPLAGTSLSGKVVDPGVDYKPMTFDDLRAGPDGVIHTGDDVFLNPIAGVKVFILGLEDQFVLTGADGTFHFDAVPAGTIKLAIDGRTATNAPAGFYFPEMVMDLQMEVGQANTVMGAMGSTAQREANRDRTEVYLPRLRTDIFETVSDVDITRVGVSAAAAPNLTPEQRQFLTLEVQPGSLIGVDGRPLTGDAARVGISTVPPQLVREMLPPGLLQHTFDITIQAPAAAVFRTPLTITFPNVFESAPGTKLNFLSFDHTTGMLVIEGTATVSADGLSVTTDPGTGITKPGWHGVTPPGDCGESGGPPPPPPDSARPTDITVTYEPERFETAAGGADSFDAVFPELVFEAPELPEEEDLLPPAPGCPIPLRLDSDEYLTVEITIDGPLAEFFKPYGNLNLESQTFTLTAGSNEKKTLAAEKKSFSEIFGAGGGIGLEGPVLYAAIVKIKEIQGRADGTRAITNRTYYVSRLMDVTDDVVDRQINFLDTLIHKSTEIPIQFKGPKDAYFELRGLDVAGDFNAVGQTFLQFSPVNPGPAAGILEVGLYTSNDVLARLAVAGTAVPAQKWYMDTAGMTEALRNSFNTSMTFEEREIFGVLNVPDPGDPGPPLPFWEFKEEMAAAFIEAVLVAAEGKLVAYDDALVRIVEPDSNAIRLNGFVAPSGEPPDYLGNSDGVDVAAGPILALAKSPSEWAPLQRAYIISKALNLRNGGTFQIYVDRYFTREDVPYFETELRSALAKSIVHEIGHQLGLNHTNGFSGVDIMTQGIDRFNTNSFFWTHEAMLLALGLPVSPADVEKALVYYMEYIQKGEIAHLLQDSTDPSMGDGNSEPPVAFGGSLAHVLDAVTDQFRSTADFGRRLLDDGPAAISLYLANPGDQPLTLGVASILGGNGQFSITGLTPGQVIQPGQRAGFAVTFDPHLLQASTAVLRIQNSGIDPELLIPLSGTGVRAGGHGVIAALENNFGGVAPGAAATRADVLTVTNFGAAPLAITGIRLTSGAPAFALTGIPAALTTSPIVLAPGASYSLDATFAPDRLGLLRGTVEFTTDSVTTPVLRASLVGTGVAQRPIAAWGNDYVAVTTTPVGRGENTIRVHSDNGGRFSMFLPSSTPYEISIYDPETGLVAHGVGKTAAPGRGTDLTATLVFLASTAPDSDGDGLPDDIEQAIGTAVGTADTDGDGLDDFLEIEQGLDPFSGRAFATGVVARAALQGEAKEVVLEGSTLDPEGQRAYVATGNHGLAIVDTSKFQEPLVLSELDLPGEAVDVAVDSRLGLAAIANSAGGLYIVDVADPRAPVLLATIVDTITPVPITQVEVVDGVAYAALGGELAAYDMLTAERLATLNLGSSPIRGMAREGAFLYTLDASGTLRALELTAGAMVARSSLTLPATGRLFVGNGVAYAAFEQAFATVDVSNPDGLALISNPDAFNLESRTIVTNGSGLAVGVGSVLDPTGRPINALDVLDVSDPANTAGFVTRFPLPEAPQSVAIGAGIAYVADGRGGLVVVNYLPFDNRAQVPTVSITTSALDLDPNEPGIQVLEGATLPLRALIADDVQVRNVELLVNGKVVRNDVAFPFELAALALGPDGLTRVQVRATDTGGNSALSNELVFVLLVDDTPPRVQYVDPADGGTVETGLRRVTALFSEAMDLATIVPENFRLVGAGIDGSFGTGDDIAVAIATQTRNDARLVPITFAALDVGEYRLTIHAAALRDRAGNAVGQEDLVSTFTVRAQGGGGGGFGIEGLEPGYGVGRLPAALAAGDMDGDGRMDLVTANRISNTLSILLGDGQGGVHSRADVVVGDGPIHLALGDIDGDGDLDLVSASYGAASVSVLSNDGVGGVVSRVDVTVGNTPKSVVLADFDGDGDLDLAVASVISSYSTVSVFRNDGTGTFGGRRDFTVAFGNDLSALAVGDMDGDGDRDIVTNSGFLLRNNGAGIFASSGTNGGGFRFALGDLDGDGDLDMAAETVSGAALFFNTGAGVFSGRVNLSVGGTGFFPVALADIDSDGDLDWLGSRVNRLVVLRNDGTGVLGSQSNYAMGELLDWLTVVDLNGDGDLDVAGVDRAANDVRILDNDGSGGFGTRLVMLPGPPNAIVLGDLNGDGYRDIVTPNLNSNNVSVLLNSGDGVTYNRVDFGVGSSPRYVALADVDGDGDLDMAVANGYSQSVSVLLNNGAGGFGARVDVAVGNVPQFVVFGDIDGDGDQDLLSANRTSGNITILRNNGAGGFGFRVDFAGVAQNSVLALGDVDGDGDLDLVAGSASLFNAPILFRNDGLGNFTSAGTISLASANRGIVLGDIDNDGDLDLISTNESGLEVIRNDGTGNFPQLVNGSGREIVVLGWRPWAITLGDVDGDGALDLTIANASDNTASVLRNDGAGHFGEWDALFRTAIGDAVDYVVGRGAQAVALGDMDLDGDLDLVSANSNAATVTILRNDGAGGFGTPLFPVGVKPKALATGDFTGDGVLDIVTANYNQGHGAWGQLTLLVGDSVGGFARVHDLRFDRDIEYHETRFVVAGDVDADGDLDLLVSGYRPADGGTSIKFLRNDGSGDFNTEAILYGDLRPIALALGDVDGDGALDLVAANNNQSAGPGVSVLRGDGAGGFAAAVGYSVAAIPQYLVLADLDGDADLDIATANSTSNTASILVNDGRGWFGSPRMAVGSLQRAAAVLGDIDGDGDLDIVAAIYSSIVTMRNRGDGTFVVDPAVPLEGMRGFSSLALGDLDGDGDLDALAVNQVDDYFARLLNDGTGGFGSRLDFAVANDPWFIALADVDGDGDLDVATANSSNSNSVSVLRNNGAALFEARVDYAVGTRPRAMAFGDVDSDGDLDLVTANYDANNVSILRNDGSGSFGARADVAVGSRPASVALGDLDGDGDLDLVTANYHGQSITRLMNDGAGTFGSRTDATVLANPMFVALGDVDGDGDLDVLTSHFISRSLTLLRNNGAGGLGGRLDQEVGGGPFTVSVGDMDGDGDLDAVTTNFNSSSVSLLRNDGSGLFGRTRLDLPVGSSPRSIVAGDFDGDGDQDLATANAYGGTISVLLSAGPPITAARIDYAAGASQPFSITAGDIDGDGDSDLVSTGNSNVGIISVYFNDGQGGFLDRLDFTVGTLPFRMVKLGDVDNDGDLDIIAGSYDDSSVIVFRVSREE